MQRFRTKAGVILLGISLVGIALISLRAASLSPITLLSSSELRSPFFLEEWLKTGQANFWSPLRTLPPPSADSLALDQLISWRAHPSVLDPYEISELSHFLLQKSHQYQVSPVLVLSLIEVESNYRKSAVSHRGAVGMMQLMPDTAQQMARISGLEWNGPSVLQDPKSNIEFGLQYLVFLKQRFSEPEHILTAYNMGPYAVRRRLESGEELPRQYFDRVMGTVQAYQKRARRNRARPALWAKSWL